MLDGKHYTLQNQAEEVIANPVEMGCNADEIIANVMSCNTYKKAFQRYVKLTPNYPGISLEHIVSAITLYYSGFSKFDAPFDRAMNGKEELDAETIKGYNLFMSKAQCGTCHFVPQFNGVKPPYISSEFEVLGVPGDSAYNAISKDSGRYDVNPAYETLHAFRTNSIRNSSFTKPYMHNGVFKTLDEVIDFYDAGGGVGHGFKMVNQTLAEDSLHLSTSEKNAIKAFMRSLDEDVIFEKAPATLPATKMEKYKDRVPGGIY
jgi:cytochrome c peroxidase